MYRADGQCRGVMVAARVKRSCGLEDEKMGQTDGTSASRRIK